MRNNFKKGVSFEIILEVITMSLADKQLSHGEIIRILRIDRGFSLRELGRKTGITASYLSRLENDSCSNMSISILLLLCKTLNAHPSLFFDESYNQC